MDPDFKLLRDEHEDSPHLREKVRYLGGMKLHLFRWSHGVVQSRYGMCVGYVQMPSSQRWTVPVTKLLPSAPSSPVPSQLPGLGLGFICALPAVLGWPPAVEAFAKTAGLDGKGQMVVV